MKIFSQKQDQPARKKRERVWSAVMLEHRLADKVALNSYRIRAFVKADNYVGFYEFFYSMPSCIWEMVDWMVYRKPRIKEEPCLHHCEGQAKLFVLS